MNLLARTTSSASTCSWTCSFTCNTHYSWNFRNIKTCNKSTVLVFWLVLVSGTNYNLSFYATFLYWLGVCGIFIHFLADLFKISQFLVDFWKTQFEKKPSIALILRRCHSSVSQRAHTCLVWQTFLINGTLLTLFLRSVIFCHVPLLAWRHWNLYSLFSWFVQDQPLYWWTLGKPSSKKLLVIKIRPHSSLRRPHSSVSQRATHV